MDCYLFNVLLVLCLSEYQNTQNHQLNYVHRITEYTKLTMPFPIKSGKNDIKDIWKVFYALTKLLYSWVFMV